jgi:2-polyprenyl-3-methyl-5-hydroxy-6-metoxy-1,4-benzoquinol methylase
VTRPDPAVAESAPDRRPSPVAEYYDRYWSDQQRRYLPEATLRSLIFSGVTSQTRCLDVGCGAGNSYAPEFARLGAAYVAELPFAADSFDLVLCIEVLEHLFSPQRAAAEIQRVLRPGGRLVASAPNVAYWRLRANMLFGVWNPIGDELSLQQPWRDPHIRFFTPQTLTRMLSMAGFATVDTGTHNGRLLDHLTSRPSSFGQSRAYGYLERRFPSLLGMTIHAVATK